MNYTNRIKALQAMLVGVDCCKNNIQERTTEVSSLEEVDSDIWTGSNCNGMLMVLLLISMMNISRLLE